MGVLKRERVAIKNELFDELDYIDEKNTEALKNPFLNFGVENNIHTIEEYGLEYKKQKVYLSSIIRNTKLKRRKKIKIFKNYMKAQKNEFHKKITNIRIRHELQNDTFKKFYIEKTSIWKKLLALLIVFVGVLCILVYSGLLKEFINNAWINRLVDVLIQLRNDKSYINVIFMCTCIFLGLYIFNGILYYIRSFSHLVAQKSYFKTFETKIVEIQKIFKKEYRKLKKYYIKKMRRNVTYYEALGPEKLWGFDVSANDFEQKKNNLEISLNKTNKFISVSKVLNKIFKILSIITILFLLIVLIIETIKNI